MTKPVKTDERTPIGENIFYIENEILYIISKGDADISIASEVRKLINEFIKGRTKINYFIDLNEAGKYTSEARKIWRQLGENEKVKKIALLGIHPVARVVASFYMKVSGNKKSKFFSNKEEAFKWLAD
jgi:hypothetical protein